MDARYRFVIGFVTVLNALLVVILCGVVMDTRGRISQLDEVLATKQDLVNIAVPKLTLFTEEKCTGCHSERRFAGPHQNVRGEIEQALARMRAMPDARFSDEDMAKIHSSLTLLRCERCHGADQLRKLAIKSPEERMEIIRQMIAKPGSKISPDEVEEISRSFEQVLGF